MKKQIKLSLLSLCILSLSACQTWDGLMEDFSSVDMPSLSSSSTMDGRSEEFLLDGDCPEVELVGELGVLSEFTNPSNPKPGNLVSRVSMGNVQTACSYSAKSVTVDLKMVFDGVLGPHGRVAKNDTPFYSYPFFVAVTEPDGDILAKEVFAASMTYDMGQDHQVYNESLRQIIPVASRDRGSKYKILVGFQLTQQQLDYNRAELVKARAAAKAAAEAAKADAAKAPEALPAQPKAETVIITPVEKAPGAPVDLTAPAQ